MKAHLICVGSLVLACGCSHKPAATEESAWAPGAAMAFYRAEAADNAVIREHTIYPYQFVEGRAELNELGRRDVNVLAEHYGAAGGTLNVRRGDAASQLYAARCGAVMEALASAGVDQRRMTLADDFPGGDGMSSRQVVIILESKQNQPGQGGKSSSQQGDGSMLNNLLNPYSQP